MRLSRRRRRYPNYFVAAGCDLREQLVVRRTTNVTAEEVSVDAPRVVPYRNGREGPEAVGVEYLR